MVSGYKKRRQWRTFDGLDSVLEFCRLTNLPTLQSINYEADDIIASTTRSLASSSPGAIHDCADQKIRVGPNLESPTTDFDSIVIATNDKDLCQLIREEPIPIRVYRKSGILWDSSHVVRKFGVEPQLLGLLLALKGESRSGIVGVKRVGEKRARQIIEGLQTKSPSTEVRLVEGSLELDLL